MILKINQIAICLLGLAIPLSETGKQAAVIIILLCSLLYFVSKRGKLPLNVIDVSLLCFFLAVLFSAASAGGFYRDIAVPYDFSRVFHSLYALLRLVLVFIIIRYIPIEEHYKEMMLSMLLVSYLVALIWGEYNVAVGIKDFIEIKGIGHVDHSSICSGILSFITLNMVFYANGKKRYFYVIGFLAALLALIQSGSRASILAFVVALICHLFIEKRSLKYLFYTFAPIVVLLCVLPYFFPHILAKMKLGFHDPARIFIWKITVAEWLKHNLLLGIGPNNSYYINPLEYGSILGPDWKNLGHSHNTFMTILLENGFLGLFFYTLFISSVIWHLLKKKGKGIYSSIGLDISIFNLVNSMANTTFKSSNALLMVIFWALALREKPVIKGSYSGGAINYPKERPIRYRQIN